MPTWRRSGSSCHFPPAAKWNSSHSESWCHTYIRTTLRFFSVYEQVFLGFNVETCWVEAKRNMHPVKMIDCYYWIYSSTKLNRLAFRRGPPFMTAQGNLSNFWEFVYHSWSVFRFLCRFKTFIKITVARTCNLTKIVSETQRERSPKWSHLHNSSWVFEIRCKPIWEK